MKITTRANKNNTVNSQDSRKTNNQYNSPIITKNNWKVNRKIKLRKSFHPDSHYKYSIFRNEFQ